MLYNHIPSEILEKPWTEQEFYKTQLTVAVHLFFDQLLDVRKKEGKPGLIGKDQILMTVTREAIFDLVNIDIPLNPCQEFYRAAEELERLLDYAILRPEFGDENSISVTKNSSGQVIEISLDVGRGTSTHRILQRVGRQIQSEVLEQEYNSGEIVSLKLDRYGRIYINNELQNDVGSLLPSYAYFQPERNEYNVSPIKYACERGGYIIIGNKADFSGNLTSDRVEEIKQRVEEEKPSVEKGKYSIIAGREIYDVIELEGALVNERLQQNNITYHPSSNFSGTFSVVDLGRQFPLFIVKAACVLETRRNGLKSVKAGDFIYRSFDGLEILQNPDQYLLLGESEAARKRIVNYHSQPSQ